MEKDKRLELSVEINDVLTYALQQNGMAIVREICLKNDTEQDQQDLIIRVYSDIDLIEPFEQGIQILHAGEEMHIQKLKVQIKGSFLASLTERVSCVLKIGVYKEEIMLVEEQRNITALAYDEWPGLKYFPDLLAAFVTPNHPVTAELLQSSAKWLNKWTQNPSLDGYQSKDMNRIKMMAAAAYAAIQERNITYAVPPASFETIGQRVRLADAVMEQHLGTCMDMTLLYTACLEAMGLNPFLVLMRGHIFAGVWLVDESFADPIIDDPSQLEKRLSNGIHELLVVECTMMCAGKTNDFDSAMKTAERSVRNYGEFVFAVDITRARKSGVHPLPVRMKTETGYTVCHEERKEKDVTSAPDALENTFSYTTPTVKEEITKKAQWERKLLDLSLRNMLINMRLTKAVVPLLSASLSDFEDALSDGEEFQVLPRPLEWDLAAINTFTLENTNELGPYADLIALECKHRKLHTIYTSGELNSTLTKMYRSAKTSMEENGASTLYLALGLLRWFEDKSAKAPRYAPIVLIPVDITRKSASKGYVLRMRDEDAQINITLLEFLKQNFGIRIHGLNPLPIDEHGLDMKKIFATVRYGIMEETMWDVIESGFIGNFSFSQFVMWNDIHSRDDLLERNKVVRSLMAGAVDWDPTIPESVSMDEAYLPITVDSSQLRAINMAANDVSFVLHGPPGTGKSQTITAMIVNALTKGKTVLFVAEKMAALEVVQKRLAALGIGDFCLELHSNKAVKKNVLDQLKRGLEIEISGTPTEYARKVEDIRNMRRKLDAYVQKLHERRGFGKSLREIVDLYELIPEYGKELRFTSAFAHSLSQSDLDHQSHLLERLVAAGRAIGHPDGHPLSEVKQTVYTQDLKLDMEDRLTAYQNTLTDFRKGAEQFAELMGFARPCSENSWKELCIHASSILFGEDIPDFLMEHADVDQEFRIPYQYLRKKEAFDQKQALFLSRWNENFLRMDMNSFHKKYEDAGRKFFGKGRALSALTAEIQAYAAFPVETGQIPVMLTDVNFYQQEKLELEDLWEELPQRWKDILENCSDMGAFRDYESGIRSKLSVIRPFTNRISQMKAAGNYLDCIKKAKKVLDDYERMESAEKALKELLQITFADEVSDWISGRNCSCERIRQHKAVMKDWIVYRQFEKECRDSGLGVVCEAYEKGLPHNQVLDVYLRSIYKAIILSVIEKEPVLNSFTGTGFNELIQQFKKLDEEFMALTREEVFYRLAKNLPTGSESVTVNKEMNILRRAISSNGRGVSIRSLFDQIPHVLMKLCPCMLMSPISVAQYLSADNDLVDIVIFDEASQLPTCKAVGVLARGKNAVIVGDPNQMPPTSFFAGSTIDEDNLDMEDLDSILDDCLALGMPQAHLRWHYRSRHESLIAFSNHEFYENSMLTFPSVNDREKRVKLVKVNGYFERGKARVNEAEAHEIVAEIRRRFEDPKRKNQTVGVVTFNISQQILIEDLLQIEFQKDAEFDRWANTGEEQLFVKNLENVQGDERDVILFSVAFGPDADGKLSLNFGPLNRDGGWKRLNVAVTRARSEMVVFSCMTSDMIDLKRTRAKGVEALKDFLAYAENGCLQSRISERRDLKKQGISDHICQELVNAGFKFQKAVGHSNFKIDIAVIDPYHEDEYLLGILLDGDSYRQTSNTKDREVAQVQVLQGLGWKLCRIWTMDWWDNRAKELEKLMDTLQELKEQARARAEAELADQKIVEAAELAEQKEAEENELVEQKKPEEVRMPEKISEPDTTLDAGPVIQRVEIDEVQNEPVAGNAGYVLDGASETFSGRVDEEAFSYFCADYVSAVVPVTPLSAAEYVEKKSAKLIEEKLKLILETESPIIDSRLIKKTIRSFNITRSNPQLIEATEKVLKKLPYKANRQNGMKFYWAVDVPPDTYREYRVDIRTEDKRGLDEISQQELKNAVCITLQKKGPLAKDELIRETIFTMGYGRSGKVLVEAVERGLKYGRKTGEILIVDGTFFALSNSVH